MKKNIKVISFIFIIILSCNIYIPSISKEEVMYGIYMSLVSKDCNDYHFIDDENDWE